MELNKLFAMPWVLVLVGTFVIFLSTDAFYSQAVIILTIMILISYIAFSGLKDKRLWDIGINTVKGNFFKSIMIAGVGLLAVVLISSILGFLFNMFSGWGSFFDWGAYMSYSRSSIVGSSATSFSDNPLTRFAVYILSFPFVETLLVAILFITLLKTFVKKGEIKIWNPKVQGIAIIMGIVMVYYHIIAKSIALGSPNESVLLVIGVIFYVECMIIAYAKEIEPAIYHHILNNAMALGMAFVFSVFSQFWYIFAAVLALILIARFPEIRRSMF